MNIEQEIWDDFANLSGSDFMDILSCGEAAGHHGLDYDDRRSLISNGINKKLEFDVDDKIGEFIKNAGREGKQIDWNEILKLYPTNTHMKISNESFKEKWERHKNNLYGKIPNEPSAIEYLANVRWEDGIVCCPKCESKNIVRLQGVAKVLKCRKCFYKFSEKTGTIFGSTLLPLLTWYEAICILTEIKSCKISSSMLANTIGVTQMVAWKMSKKVQSKVGTQFLNDLKYGLFRYS